MTIQIEELKNYQSDITPKDFDVLCGERGRSNSKRAGNSLYQELIASNVTRYFEAYSIDEKKLVALDIVDAIEHNNGRFLKRTDGIWCIQTRQEAAYKVKKALQDRKRNVSIEVKPKRKKKFAPPTKESQPNHDHWNMHMNSNGMITKNLTDRDNAEISDIPTSVNDASDWKTLYVDTFPSAVPHPRPIHPDYHRQQDQSCLNKGLINPEPVRDCYNESVCQPNGASARSNAWPDLNVNCIYANQESQSFINNGFINPKSVRDCSYESLYQPNGSSDRSNTAASNYAPDRNVECIYFNQENQRFLKDGLIHREPVRDCSYESLHQPNASSNTVAQTYAPDRNAKCIYFNQKRQSFLNNGLINPEPVRDSSSYESSYQPNGASTSSNTVTPTYAPDSNGTCIYLNQERQSYIHNGLMNPEPVRDCSYESLYQPNGSSAAGSSNTAASNYAPDRNVKCIYFNQENQRFLNCGLLNPEPVLECSYESLHKQKGASASRNTVAQTYAPDRNANCIYFNQEDQRFLNNGLINPEPVRLCFHESLYQPNGVSFKSYTAARTSAPDTYVKYRSDIPVKSWMTYPNENSELAVHTNSYSPQRILNSSLAENYQMLSASNSYELERKLVASTHQKSATMFTDVNILGQTDNESTCAFSQFPDDMSCIL